MVFSARRWSVCAGCRPVDLEERAGPETGACGGRGHDFQREEQSFGTCNDCLSSSAESWMDRVNAGAERALSSCRAQTVSSREVLRWRHRLAGAFDTSPVGTGPVLFPDSRHRLARRPVASCSTATGTNGLVRTGMEPALDRFGYGRYAALPAGNTDISENTCPCAGVAFPQTAAACVLSFWREHKDAEISLCVEQEGRDRVNGNTADG